MAFVHFDEEINFAKLESEFDLSAFDHLTSLDGEEKSAVNLHYWFIDPSFEYESPNIIKKAFMELSIPKDFAVLSLPTEMHLGLIQCMTRVEPRYPSVCT